MLLTGFAVITEVRNDPGLDQYAVGFVQQHAEVGHNIAVKLLEQDQALTDLDLKGLYCLCERTAKVFRCHRIDR